jgi:hypothetical protein
VSLSGARQRTQGPTGMWCARRRSCSPRTESRTPRSRSDSRARARRYRSGEDGFARRGCTVLRRDRDRVRRGVFPPAQVAEVKALACELPAEQGVPLSRWSSAELALEAVKRGIVASIAAVTIWRWLSEDAIRGTIARGSSRAIRSSRRRLAGSLICTRAAGRGGCWSRASSWCAAMRSRRSKPVRASTQSAREARRAWAAGRARV